MVFENGSEPLSRLARDLRSEASHDETMQHVVDAAVDMIAPCQAAGISLATLHGRVKTSASSGPVPRRGDELQVELREGPCVDAVWHRRVVMVVDLEAETRWPLWGPRAASELGVRSMLSVRMFTHEDTVGALNLYSTEPRAFGLADIDQGTAIAAHAAVAAEAALKIENLETALDSRTVIAQATGMVMAQYRIDSATAFKLLIRVSNERNRKVSALAAEMVLQHDEGTGRDRAAAQPAPPLQGLAGL